MGCQLLIKRLSHAVIICLILCALQQGEATVTLTAPSSPPCLSQTYKLTCTHPVLVTSTLLWERNGVFYGIQGNPTHVEMVNSEKTVTTLTINVTREEFENTSYTYRCYTNDQVTNERVYSNNITLDPPVTTLCWRGSTLIYCNWTLVEQICFPDTTYRCRCTRVSDNEVIINTTTNGTEFMFSELEPNTEYSVEIFLDGTNSQISSPMKLTTFERVIVTQVSFDKNTATLTCKHHRMENAIYSDPPRISWMRNGTNVTSEVTIIITEPFQTVNMTVEDGDEVSCSIQLITGGVEESDPIKIQYPVTVIPTGSANTGLIIGIVVGCVAAVVLLIVATVIIIVCYKQCYLKNQKCQPESDSETKDMEINNPEPVNKTPRDSATIVYADIDHKKSKGPENVENPMINETTYTQIKCDKPEEEQSNQYVHTGPSSENASEEKDPNRQLDKPEEEQSNQYVHTGPSSENASEEKDPNRQLRKRLVRNFSRESPKDEKALHFSQEFFGPPDE